jgi:glycosyltransferase involved in cell wall biosynthesis
MKITLITEGTYPYNLGGVSVWCDQLLREMAEHSFEILAISATGTEKNIWGLPGNVVQVGTVPLWAPTPRRRVGPSLRKRFAPVQELFLRSLAIESHGEGFTSSLRELSRFARTGELSAAMSSEDAVEMLVAMAPRCNERTGGQSPGPMSVGDAVEVLVQLEHFLRPLSVPPPRTDLCHTTANGLGTLPALAAKWTWGTPFLMTEHGVYLRERYLSYLPGSLGQPARAIVLRFFKLLIETAYENADIVAPVCRYNRLWEIANGTSPERIRPVHNGIDLKSFPVAATEPAVPTLVFVGRIDPLKDIETLLRAFAEVRATVPQARLRIFGPTPEGGEDYFRRCLDLAGVLGLQDGSVTFEGPISPTVKAYHAGHVLVLTSISEGLPYVVLEAMASGRPVVATDVGGVAEGVGSAGILVPPRDPSAVAAACARLLTDEHLRRALARKARDRAVQLFAAERCFALYRSLYEELGPSQGKYIALPTEHDEDIAIPIEQEVFHLASSGPFVGATPGEGLVEPEVLA